MSEDTNNNNETKQQKRLILEDRITKNQLLQHSCLPMWKEITGEYGNHPRTKAFYYIAPYRDFHHAVGKNKPWENWENGDIDKYYSKNDENATTSNIRQPQDEANNAVAVSVMFVQTLIFPQ